MNALARLGPHRIDAFMRSVWQRKPLLVRQALPEFRSPVTREQLFRLAARDDVESRCVTAFGGRWRLAHGPFAGDALPPLSRRRWTLLVQGLDLHLTAAAELLSRFRFVSDARLDDLMASFATDGGGVGPHVDSYDVFLIQAHGRRRWRIGRQRDRALVPGLPLAILSDFRPSAEWVLEPGDLLYLPPGVAHDGVALGQCITLSVGFRSPAWQELAEPWFLQQAARARMPGRYADAGARPTGRPGALPAAMIDETWRRFARLRPRRSDGIEMLLAVLTEPKPQVVFDRPRRAATPAAIARAATAGRLRLRLDLRSRCLYSGRRFAINGELLPTRDFDPLLATLADTRELAADSLRGASPALLAMLSDWLAAGWLHRESPGTLPDGRTRD
jgi:50S ribosomal protein L16 3-hydroxylase